MNDNDKLLIMCHKALEELEGRQSTLPVTYNLIKAFIHKWGEFKQDNSDKLK